MVNYVAHSKMDGPSLKRKRSPDTDGPDRKRPTPPVWVKWHNDAFTYAYSGGTVDPPPIPVFAAETEDLADTLAQLDLAITTIAALGGPVVTANVMSLLTRIRARYMRIVETVSDKRPGRAPTDGRPRPNQEAAHRETTHRTCTALLGALRPPVDPENPNDPASRWSVGQCRDAIEPYTEALPGCRAHCDRPLHWFSSAEHTKHIREDGPMMFVNEGSDADFARRIRANPLVTSIVYTFSDLTDAGAAILDDMSVPATHVNFSFSSDLTDETATTLARLEDLQSVNLGGTQLTDTGVEALSHLAKLTTLDLKHTPITDKAIEHLHALSTLTSLKIASVGVLTDAVGGHLAAITTLTDLSIYGMNALTDAGVEAMSALPNLWTLSLSLCPSLTDMSARHVATMLTLHELNFTNMVGLTDAGVDHIATLPALTKLNLRACLRLTDASATHLASSKTLRTIDLSYCTNLTDETLKTLKLDDYPPFDVKMFGTSMSPGLKAAANYSNANPDLQLFPFRFSF